MSKDRLKSVTLSCDNCESKYHPGSHYRNHKHHFCSRKCFQEYEKTHDLGGGFPKGNPYHWKKMGLPHPQLNTHRSEKTKQKIREGHKQYHKEVNEDKRKSHLTREYRAKISRAGSKRWHQCSEEERRKWLKQIVTVGKSNKGRERPDLAKINRVLKRGPKNPNWRGGRSLFHGHGWEKLRQEVWKRDDFRCQKCGRSRDEVTIVAHHIVPYRISHDNSLDNLVTLCSSCHKREEWALQQKYFSLNFPFLG